MERDHVCKLHFTQQQNKLQLTRTAVPICIIFSGEKSYEPLCLSLRFTHKSLKSND